MSAARSLAIGLAACAGLVSTAGAQVPLYAQRLPEGTVYVRLVNALPGAATINTSFTGKLDLGDAESARVSPYFVSVDAGGKTVPVEVTEGGHQATATFSAKSGTFNTVVLQRKGDGVAAVLIADKPDYNQLRARLSFYNATADCAGATLTEGTGRAVFSNLAPGSGQSRTINPAAAKVTAGCAAGKAPTLDLGQLDAGGLYTVWLMKPEGGAPISFMAHDTIAPPRQ